MGEPALSQGERVDRRRRFSAGAGRVRGQLANDLAYSVRGQRETISDADL
jgi:hypothetical protein